MKSTYLASAAAIALTAGMAGQMASAEAHLVFAPGEGDFNRLLKKSGSKDAVPAAAI